MTDIGFKIKKVATIASWFFLYMIFAGCSDKKEEGGPTIREENEEIVDLAIRMENTLVQDQTIYVDETKGDEFTFVANNVWSSSVQPPEAASWISISPSSGDKGKHTVSINLMSIPIGKDRSAKIIIECNNDEVAVNVKQKATKSPTIYIAGNRRNNNGVVAVLWKNGVAEELTDGIIFNAFAYSVFVSGSDVFVAGYDTSWKGLLWKNGEAHNLTDGTNSADASSVFVSDNDVYVVGAKNHYATLWKYNTLLQTPVEQRLFHTMFSYGYSVFVSDNDVYVAGYEYDVGAKLWKNGEVQDLTDRTYSYAFASSVFVSGSNVYVAGNVRNNKMVPLPVLWKNGAVQHLTDDTYGVANSVYVSGDDVYVAGFVKNSAVLWKNGEIHYLTDGTNFANARSVFVLDSNVYVAGEEYNGQATTIAKLWKNGVTQDLASMNSAEAYSVYVK